MTDRHILDLVRRADPVPDPDCLPEPRHGALALLDGPVEQRTSATSFLARPDPQPLPERRWLRPATAFGAALVLTLGTIGVIALAGGDESPGVADSSAPTTPTEAPAAQTTVTDAVLPAPTTLVPSATTEPPGVTLLDGAWIGAELEFRASQIQGTSIGLVSTGGGSIWLSSDGATWDEVFRGPFEPFDAPQPADPEPGLASGRVSTTTGAIVEYGSAVYVFGHVATNVDPRGASELDRYVWRSGDGADWEQIKLPPSSQMHSGISGVAAVGDRLLAWVSGDRGMPILFLSDDGAGWVAIESGDSNLGGDDLAIVVAYDDHFFAITRTYGEGEEKHQIYTSPTGESWEPGYEFETDAYPHYSGAATDEALFLSGVAFGQLEAGIRHPGLWRTPDGVSFDQVVLPSAAYDGWGYVTEVVATPRGLLVVAWLTNLNDDETGHIALFADDNESGLQSVDVPEGLFADAYPHDATFLGDRIVIVGDKAGTAFLWLWSPDS